MKLYNNKDVIVLSGLFPSEIRNEIISNSKINTQFAADALQSSIIKGLAYYYKNLKVLNFPFIGAYPMRYKFLSIKTFRFGMDDGFDGLNSGYINLAGYKNVDIYRKTKRYLQNWVKDLPNNKVILIYHAYLPFLKAAVNVKRQYKNVEICLILPDLPQFMNSSGNVLYRLLRKYIRIELEKLFKSVNYYVLLSKYMIEKLPKQNVDWIVMEGIFDETDLILLPQISIKKDFVFYSGNLAKRYGIMNLVNAFKLLKDFDYNLLICGDGDAKGEILLAGNEDERIIYKGTLDRREVLALQSRASLLVNPRTSEGVFTKFSFPSKTLEYMASGIPTLLYKLPGIPDEYFNYCFSLDETSPLALANKIKEILLLDKEYRTEFGERAKKFILDRKTPKEQCGIIFNLIEGNHV